MEALTEDIVFSISAYLRPRDLVNLALTSRRFGGRPSGARIFGADAETRATKRRRHNYFRGAKKGEDSGDHAALSLSAILRPRDLAHWALTSLRSGRKGAKASAVAEDNKSDGGAEGEGRKWPLMEEVAKRHVAELEDHFSFELLQRQGDESWMALLLRLDRQRQLIEETMAAVPALFAKPGDQFCSRDDNSHFIGDSRVEYMGRTEVDLPGRRPKKGWLHFCNAGGEYHINITDGGIRDTLGAWPKKVYSYYTPDGVPVHHTLCIPPEKCGGLNLPEVYGDRGDLIPPRDIKERVKETLITTEMIDEAKTAMPVLVAKPGDLFEWEGVVLIYTGRNEVPPIQLPGTVASPKMVDSAQIGWLVFHSHDKRLNIDALNGGIRDGLGAWPKDVYSHYDESGKRVAGTLCLPPEKCGLLKVYVEPVYEDLMREEFR